MIDFKKYFTFKKADRIGLITLTIIVLLLFTTNLIIKKRTTKNKNYDFSEFAAQVDSFMQTLTKTEENDVYVSKLDSFIIAKYDTLNLFTFDPNNTTENEFLKLGLTKKQIKTISNYKDRGGKFFIKDDFRKIYGIRTMQYKLLKPYLDLPDEYNKAGKRNFYDKSKYATTNTKIELFEFDPNTATDEQFYKLGLSKRQVSTIKKYLSKGGKFYKKEDFKKIYGISEELYQQLMPYIDIVKSSKDDKKISENKKYTEEIPIIHINTADTTMFMKLPGIGANYARRIIKYREKLGGFYSVQQISEVYGIKIETYKKILPYLKVNSKNIKKININLANYADLVSHPYIEKKTANKILKYKRKNGFFTSANQLLENNVIGRGLYKRIEKYLTVE